MSCPDRIDHSENFMIFRFCLLALISWLGSTSIFSSDDTVKPGEIINIACRSDNNQSYTAYLPTNYSVDQNWPVIMIFEPAARGRLPVELFKEAAEQYGYILAASNNSRNYDDQLISESVNALWDDVMNRFTIDGARIYTAGMSGGARVAILIADQSKKVAGVIACAAGFGPGCSPSSDDTFVFAGTMGNVDFNFLEFKQLEPELEHAGIPKTMLYFKGTHGWPPPAQALMAVQWLEIQAMKKGIKAKDDEWLSAHYQMRLKAIKNLPEGLEKMDRLTQLIKDFDGLVNIDDEKIWLEVLSHSPVLVEDQELETDLAELEHRLRRKFDKRILYINSPGYDPVQGRKNIEWFKMELKKFRKQAEKENLELRKNVYIRVEASLSTYCFEMMIAAMNKKDFNKAKLLHQYVSTISPQNPGNKYNLACILAQQGKKKKAANALKEAVELGFRNLEILKADSDLDSIRETAGYKEVIQKLKGLR